ncbi:hypothetical protein Goshw_006200 [Gossypium schwendimanii]|uniref:Uncharacterized protein n=1 Tax=Gossypium schwendimanii TaxID=34291 RepID=A0A7J9MFZ6_GOSSC|nr:hypothetical protein [Gossypium schwendimanii]
MSSFLLQFLGFPPKSPLFPSFVFPFWSSKNIFDSDVLRIIFVFFFLKRNVRKCVGGDKLSSTCRETEGPKVVNGLESKIACDSSKVSYALDREDFLFQAKQKLVSDQNN